MRVVLLGLMILITAAAAWRLIQWRIWENREALMNGLYSLPMAPLLFWWMIAMLQRPQHIKPYPVLIDALAVTLAASRIAGPFFPASGHVLFLVYSFLATRNVPYRYAAATMLVLTLVCKFVLFHDPITPTTGAIAAVILWRLRCSAMRDSRSRWAPSGARGE